MDRKAYFFIDDVIFVFRDLAKDRPASIFDNAFLAMLKKAHDDNGLKVQLNLFYRTDFFYGSQEFTLADMPDCYKDQFQAASDWLFFAFHAKQEFPDYPYVNATYEDVKSDYEAIAREVRRFAGAELAPAVVPHWLPISKEGCRALRDCGVKIISPSTGDTTEYNGDPTVLPYGHSFRLLQNRQPETKLFIRKSKNTAITSSLCAYNHISQEQADAIRNTMDSVTEPEFGLRFRNLGGGPTINLNNLEDLQPFYDKVIGKEFIGTGTHEQYFYPDYYAYQPDTAEKIYHMSKIMKDNGYRYISAWDM